MVLCNCYFIEFPKLLRLSKLFEYMKIIVSEMTSATMATMITISLYLKKRLCTSLVPIFLIFYAQPWNKALGTKPGYTGPSPNFYFKKHDAVATHKQFFTKHEKICRAIFLNAEVFVFSTKLSNGKSQINF